jgi:hypothetical protein
VPSVETQNKINGIKPSGFRQAFALGTLQLSCCDDEISSILNLIYISGHTIEA